jgi:hypothetical protein
MYSDIKINVGKSPWIFEVNAATGKHATRELTNERMVLVALLMWLFVPKNLSRRKEYNWLLEFLPTWVGGNSDLEIAVRGVSDKTLERYINAVSEAELTLPNLRRESFASYFRRHDTLLAAALTYATDQGVIDNEWMAEAIGAVNTTTTAGVFVASDQSAVIVPGASATIKDNFVITNAATSEVFVQEVPVPTPGFEYEVINNLGHQKDEEAVAFNPHFDVFQEASPVSIGGMIDEINFMPRPKPKTFWDRLKNIFG